MFLFAFRHSRLNCQLFNSQQIGSRFEPACAPIAHLSCGRGSFAPCQGDLLQAHRSSPLSTEKATGELQEGFTRGLFCFYVLSQVCSRKNQPADAISDLPPGAESTGNKENRDLLLRSRCVPPLNLLFAIRHSRLNCWLFNSHRTARHAEHAPCVDMDLAPPVTVIRCLIERPLSRQLSRGRDCFLSGRIGARQRRSKPPLLSRAANVWPSGENVI
jgi:hypothetical protein